MDDLDEEKEIDKAYRRDVVLTVVVGGLGLLYIMGKLLSVHLNLVSM